ncbi:undecaprenyl-diphosphate phosphatase [Candidatus Saccharibacteria bacterium]|nr:undecaprenyl-diphosphate phosphatase [Candidatus Saccharibacteria bacterium]
MQALEIIILGIIQGLTEFIPISSSGHLVIAQNFFSGASDHLYLEFINIGTFVALLVYFRTRIIDIVRDIFLNKKYKLALNILITALPAGIIGFMLSDFIGSSAFFGSLVVVAVTLGLVGIIMILLESFPKASAVNDGESLSYKRALIIGLAQVSALIPGVSRSGSTIIAGRLAGLNVASAAEYSFLASLPIMFGVTLKVLVSDRTYLMSNLGPLILGNVVAFISGIIAVGFLMKYLSRHSLAIFGWYRIGLSAVLALVLLLQ